MQRHPQLQVWPAVCGQGGHPFHGLGAVALSRSRTTVQRAEPGQAHTLPWRGTPAWGKLGEWHRGAERKGPLGDPFAFMMLLPLSTSTPSPLSGQSCPATLRGTCVAGTRISPVTSNGSSARGKARALTTPPAQVRAWLLFGGTQEPGASQSLQSPGPISALCPPSSPLPVEQAHLGQPGSTRIWAGGDAEH